MSLLTTDSIAGFPDRTTSEVAIYLENQSYLLAPQPSQVKVFLCQLCKGDVIQYAEGDALRIVTSAPVITAKGNIEFSVMTPAGLNYSFSCSEPDTSVILVSRYSDF